MICFTYIYEKTSSHYVDTTCNLKYIVFGGLPPPPKTCTFVGLACCDSGVEHLMHLVIWNKMNEIRYDLKAGVIRYIICSCTSSIILLCNRIR